MENAKKALLTLPLPRIWTPKMLAAFLHVSVHWVYKRARKDSEDPIPRIQGIGRLRFDTENLEFQVWMRRLFEGR